MKNRAVITTLTFLFGLTSATCLVQSQESKQTNGGQPPPSLQEQIEELKTGQLRLLKELEAIRALLQEKADRSDFPTRTKTPDVIPMNVQGEPFRGASKARIAIMEYSDFDCSYCARYVREIFPKLEAEYLKPGKVKYFFRDLPAPEHTNSLAKARAARCAGEQGKFWEMHDRLFAAAGTPGSEDLSALAQALGLEAEKFNACLSSGKYAENIKRVAAGAGRIGVYGTPAFLIGTASEDGNFFWATKVIVGAESYEPLKTAIDELLASPPK